MTVPAKLPKDELILINAKYAGRCHRCDSLIVEGQAVRWNPLTSYIEHADRTSCDNAADANAQYDGDWEP